MVIFGFFSENSNDGGRHFVFFDKCDSLFSISGKTLSEHDQLCCEGPVLPIKSVTARRHPIRQKLL